jgi:hypothetical protein
MQEQAGRHELWYEEWSGNNMPHGPHMSRPKELLGEYEGLEPGVGLQTLEPPVAPGFRGVGQR